MQFIWGNNTRIALPQLEKDTVQGGLKMLNLKCFNSALKLSWVKRLSLSNDFWQHLLEPNFKKRKYIWELDIDSLESYVRNTSNCFWKAVLKAWIE